MINMEKYCLVLIMLTLFTNTTLATDEKLSPGSSSEITEQDEYISVRKTLQTCFTCHGDKGASTIGMVPILGGQEFYYMYVQLKDMKKGLRASSVMSPIVAGIKKEDLKLMAQYFSEQPWPKTNYSIDSKRAKAARLILSAGQCTVCHLATLKGNSRVPRLSNQHPEYLKNTMNDFKNNIRKNAPAMTSLFKTLNEQEIQDVSDYLGSFNAK
jgi:cytochrome c553